MITPVVIGILACTAGLAVLAVSFSVVSRLVLAQSVAGRQEQRTRPRIGRRKHSALV